MHNHEIVNDIIKTFSTINPKYSHASAFHDMVTCFAVALSNRVDKVQFQSREDEYLRIVANYDSETIDIFISILGKLTLGLANVPSDILGNVYLQLKLHNTSMGQHFTPDHVAVLMAEVSLLGDKDTIQTNGNISVLDICCGSGALLIGKFVALQNNGYNPTKHMEVYAKDLNALPAMMCYVQLFILGVPGIIVQGNGLTDEVIQEWFLPYYSMNETSNNTIADIPLETIYNSQEYQQLTLF